MVSAGPIAETMPEAEEQERDIAALREPTLAKAVEDLIELLSQGRRAFLLGAGSSRCAGLPLMEDLSKQVLERIGADNSISNVFSQLSTQMNGARACTIEDYLSELADHISMCERRKHLGIPEPSARVGTVDFKLAELHAALGAAKQAIRESIHRTRVSISTHREFVRALHFRLQAGKASVFQPVEYFTLNYDTVLEDALSLEKVPYEDGFAGGPTGWWNLSNYGSAAACARVYKLHGSVDWCSVDDDPLPRRIRSCLSDVNPTEQVLVWPSATKYREAQRDPFAQVLSIMRKTLRPARNSELVLVVVGYSFGDAHINLELDQALRDSEGRLTMVVLVSGDEPHGLLRDWLENPRTAEHLRVHTNRGFQHGSIKRESTLDLRWWKFELLTRLLGGSR